MCHPAVSSLFARCSRGRTVYLGYIGVILVLYRDYIGIMEKKMEATTMGYIGFRVYGPLSR